MSSHSIDGRGLGLRSTEHTYKARRRILLLSTLSPDAKLQCPDLDTPGQAVAQSRSSAAALEPSPLGDGGAVRPAQVTGHTKRSTGSPLTHRSAGVPPKTEPWKGTWRLTSVWPRLWCLSYLRPGVTRTGSRGVGESCILCAGDSEQTGDSRRQSTMCT
jgi:hypothetical protein